MTCVSERSGSASSGMRRIVQIDSASTAPTAAMTRYLFSAEKRMTRLITSLPPHSGQRRAQPGLGVDEEVGAGHHLLAGREPRHDLHRVPPGGAEPHLARLELPLPHRDEDHLLRA